MGCSFVTSHQRIRPCQHVECRAFKLCHHVYQTVDIGFLLENFQTCPVGTHSNLDWFGSRPVVLCRTQYRATGYMRPTSRTDMVRNVNDTRLGHRGHQNVTGRRLVRHHCRPLHSCHPGASGLDFKSEQKAQDWRHCNILDGFTVSNVLPYFSQWI